MIKWNNEVDELEEKYERFKSIIYSIDPNSFIPLLEVDKEDLEEEKENIQVFR